MNPERDLDLSRYEELAVEHALFGCARSRLHEDLTRGQGWRVDLSRAELTVGSSTHRCQLLGRYDPEAHLFVWGWADPDNEGWGPSLEATHRLALLGHQPGNAVFRESTVHDSWVSPGELAAVCAEIAGGYPVFVGESGGRWMYFLVTDVTIDPRSIPTAYLPGLLFHFQSTAMTPVSRCVPRFLQRLGMEASGPGGDTRFLREDGTGLRIAWNEGGCMQEIEVLDEKIAPAEDRACAGPPGLAVQLLFDGPPPRFEAEEALPGLRDRLGPLDLAPREPGDSTAIFLLAREGDEEAPGLPPPHVAVLGGASLPDRATIEKALEQTWIWKDAERALSAATHTVVVAELAATHLPPARRVAFFGAVARTAVARLQPVALLWPGIELAMAPDHLLVVPMGETVIDDLLGMFNTRYFRVEGCDEILMDTLGLERFGLPDLQCHFRDLDPSDVGAVLKDLACYLYERGPVIEDGDTVRGIRDDETWACRHEKALSGPERPVIDLDPGDPFRAGRRSADPGSR